MLPIPSGESELLVAAQPIVAVVLAVVFCCIGFYMLLRWVPQAEINRDVVKIRIQIALLMFAVAAICLLGGIYVVITALLLIVRYLFDLMMYSIEILLEPTTSSISPEWGCF